MSVEKTSLSGRGTALLHVAALLLTGLAVGWPVLLGDLPLYLDNPVHLAELSDLVRGRTWSDSGLLGISLATLHSPLWYQLIAGLTRVGLPLVAVYQVFVFLGLVAPSLAVYKVGRRLGSPSLSFLLAWLLLVQPSWIRGNGSPLGGMWTFGLAAAFLVLFADALADRERPARPRWLTLAWTLGLVGLTHLYVLAAALLLIPINLLLSLNYRSIRSQLADFAAFFLAACASSAYWMPMLLGRDPLVTYPPNPLTPAQLAQMLLLPRDILDIYLPITFEPGSSPLLEMIPIWLLLGFLVLLPLARGRAAVRGLPGLALLFGLSILGLVTAAELLDLTLLGPTAWRFLYFARLAAALAGLGVAGGRLRVPAFLSTRAVARSRVGLVAPLVLAAASLLFSPALANSQSTAKERGEVRELWSWLEANRDSTWQRVYFQDTYMTPPLGLRASHVLALSGVEAGVRPVGTYYGMVPAGTSRWLLSEFNRLFGMSLRSHRDGELLFARARLAGVSHLVVSNPDLARVLESGPFLLLHRVGRFSVLRFPPPLPSLLEPSPGIQARVEEDEGDRIVLEVESDQEAASVLVKYSHHPFWELDSPEEAKIVRTREGLLSITGIPPGTHQVVLTHRPPLGPWVLTIGAWLFLAAALVRSRFSRKSEANPARAQLEEA